MALHIEDAEIESLANEAAKLAHESTDQAVRRALIDRQGNACAATAAPRTRRQSACLPGTGSWPFIPPEIRGHPLTKEEEDEILGFGPDGY